MARPGAALGSRSFFSFISALWCMISLVNHMNILVIEDEQLLSGSLRELLAQHGFAAEAAYDGPLGLELALTGVYDLIILDVMLPGMDGYEIARRLRLSTISHSFRAHTCSYTCRMAGTPPHSRKNQPSSMPRRKNSALSALSSFCWRR